MKTVFLHGLGQTAASWSAVAQLTGSAYACPELFASGRSDYRELIGALEVRLAAEEAPLRLCGLSLGAVLALDLALRQPEKVGELVLIGGQYKMPRFLLKIRDIMFRFMPERAFSGGGLSKRETIELTRSMRDIDFSSDLPSVQCRTAVLCGENDKANIRAAREMSAAIPNAELHIIAGSGHEVNIDAPAAIAEIINAMDSGLDS